VSARRLLAIVCIVTFWVSGRLLGEFYPFSPLGMFDQPATVAGRLFVRDAAGSAREIARYEAWRCDGPLVFDSPPACPDAGYSAYDDIVRDFIVANPADRNDTELREPLEITRRVFEIPDPFGPVKITDCPLLRCTARRRSGSWTHRL
jgi:hypothetical protein